MKHREVGRRRGFAGGDLQEEEGFIGAALAVQVPPYSSFDGHVHGLEQGLPPLVGLSLSLELVFGS